MQRTPTCRNCCRNYSFHHVSKQKTANIPLLLDCGHTYCEGCITKFAGLSKTQIMCPECSTPTQLTKEGVLGIKELNINVHVMGVLATNVHRKSLMESGSSRKGTSNKFNLKSEKGIQQAASFLSEQKKTAKPIKMPELKCEECFSATAASRCVKCECVFCIKCFEKVHSLSHILRKHQPLPLLHASADKSTAGCSVHDNRPLEFYDKDENQPVCAHCVVVGDRERHNVVPITDVADSIKESLKEGLTEGKTILKYLDKSQKKIREVLYHNLSDKSSLVQEIRDHFLLLSSTLQVRENTLIKDVESTQSNEESLEMGVVESLRKTRNLLMELEDTLLDPTTLVNKSKKFISELDKLKDVPCFAVKISNCNEEMSGFLYDKEYFDSLKTYGKVQEIHSTGVEMKKLTDVSEEDKMEELEVDCESLNAEEDLEDDDDVDLMSKGHRTQAARKLLSIPYRHELVQVTHIKDPSYFMVQRLADVEQLNVMMDAINKYCDSSDASDLVFEVNVGDIVCAQFSVDNHWYRARVMSVYSQSHPNTLPTIENNLTLQVLYMDYGNTEWVPMIRLRTMTIKFLQVPDMAVCCCLVDIVPPLQQAQWPSKTIKAFGSLTGNKSLLMTALRRGTGGILHVDLKSPDDEEPTNDDRPASVRDALVFLEVARFKSPASQPGVEGQQSFPMREFKNPTPVEEGQKIAVLVTHATGPDEIYLQTIEDESVRELLHVMGEMDKLYNGKSKRKDLKVSWPYRGLVCSAQFSEDKVWYRALVLGVNSDETVNVTYVDYGNSERLPFSAVRKLPDSLLGLPKQARQASLADLKPSVDGGDWNEQVQGFVCELLIGKTFLASITGVNDNNMSIVLYDNSSIKELSVNNLLVQSKLAVTTGMGIVKEYTKEEEKVDVEEEKDDVASEEPLEEKPCDEQSDEVEASVESETSDTVQLCEEKEEKADDEVVPGVVDEQEPQEEKEPTAKNEPVLPSSTRQKLLSYRSAVLPVDKQFQAGVTFVGMDGFIYVQEIKPDDTTLIDIMSGLNNHMKEHPNESSIPTSIDDILIGQPCCARFSDDNMWYRVLVAKVMGNNKVQVNYVDFGNSEVVHLSELRMDALYIDTPKQCLKLVLHGVLPANSEGRWSMKAISVLSKLVVGKNCSVMIEGEKREPIEVRLCSTEGINVCDALLSQGLAWPAEGMQRMETNVIPLPAGARMGPPSKGRKAKNHLSQAQTKLQAMLIGAREAEHLLPNTQLPQIAIPFDVIVTHVEQPDSLFIQRSPNCDDDSVYDVDPTLLDVEEELEKLEEMAVDINKPDYFKKYEPLKDAHTGMLCCGLYTEDDTWYRGQVLSVESENPLKALVRYFDYGNTEVLTGDRMRGFPYRLMDLPIQATQCRLAHVKPPKTADSLTEGSPWPSESKEQLVELVVGKRLQASIVACGPPVSIIICDPSDDNTDIAQALAKTGLAIYKHSNHHDNEGEEMLDSLSEGAPSQSSYDVEIEEEVIEEDNDLDSTAKCVLELRENKVDFPVVDIETKVGPALLTPDKFSVTKDKDDTNTQSPVHLESGSNDVESEKMETTVESSV